MKHDASASSSNFTFITGNTPSQLESRERMTQVRKQAINSYLLLGIVKEATTSIPLEKIGSG